MKIITTSTEYTIKIGEMIAENLKPNDVIALFGNLGSGKTVLVKGIAKGLSFNSKTVSSPSFVLVKEYSARIPLYHFDLYRIKDASQVYRIGYEEYLLNKGVCVIEWAERISELLPKEHLKIELSIMDDNTRLMKFIPRGRRYRELVRQMCRL